MPLMSINFENKPKHLVSLGLILMLIGFIYLLGILWIFDYSSTKYIITEITLSKYTNLSDTTMGNIKEIQKTRLDVPLKLAKNAGPLALLIVLVGAICYIIGFYSPWNKDEEEKIKKAKETNPTRNNPTFKMLAEYFWVVGLSLVVVGATKIFTNPIGILIVGVILFLIGTALKSLLHK